MAMDSNTKRASYFSEGELEVLMLAYEEFKPIIIKKSNTAASAKERETAWQKITDIVNACKPSGAKRTLAQVKMKHKNILQKINRKKAEARQTGGASPPAEELTLSLNRGRPVVEGILGGTSSHTAAQGASNLVTLTDGQVVLSDPPAASTQFMTREIEITSVVRELDNASTSIENSPGDADEGPSPSSQNLSSLSAKEPYPDHPKQRIKTDFEMDLIRLKIEEKKLAIKKAQLEIEMLEFQLKEMKNSFGDGTV